MGLLILETLAPFSSNHVEELNRQRERTSVMTAMLLWPVYFVPHQRSE